MPKKRGKPNRRRLAALKGWRTRRRNQEKRHRATLKGPLSRKQTFFQAEKERTFRFKDTQ